MSNEERRTTISQREEALQDFQNQVERLKNEIAEQESLLTPLNQQVLDLKELIVGLEKDRDAVLLELNNARPKASEIIYQAGLEADKIREEARLAYEKQKSDVEDYRKILLKDEEDYKARVQALLDREKEILPKEQSVTHRLAEIQKTEDTLKDRLSDLYSAEKALKADQEELDADRKDLAGLRQVFEEEVLAHEEKVKAFKADVSEFQVVRDDVKAKQEDIASREAALVEAQTKIDEGLKSQEDARIFNEQRMLDLDAYEAGLKQKNNALNEREALLTKSREG